MVVPGKAFRSLETMVLIKGTISVPKCQFKDRFVKTFGNGAMRTDMMEGVTPISTFAVVVEESSLIF
jgi:hypothetical protein